MCQLIHKLSSYCTRYPVERVSNVWLSSLKRSSTILPGKRCVEVLSTFIYSGMYFALQHFKSPSMTIHNECKPFFVRYEKKQIPVSPHLSSNGTFFIVHLEEGDITLKLQDYKTKQWLDVNDGETALASKIGSLIECAPFFR